MSDIIEELVIERHRRPVPVQIPNVFGGRVVVYGFAVKETTGAAPAEVQLWNQSPQGGGFDAVPITLSANESRSEWYGPHGIEFNQGLNAVLASGAVVGSVFVHIFEEED